MYYIQIGHKSPLNFFFIRNYGEFCPINHDQTYNIYNVKGKKKERDWKRDMFIYIKIVNDFL